MPEQTDDLSLALPSTKGYGKSPSPRKKPPKVKAQEKDFGASVEGIATALAARGQSREQIDAALAGIKDSATKCGMDMEEEWHPFGGAESFADADLWELSMNEQWEVNDLSYTFSAIVDNIWDDDDIDTAAKAAKIAAAAAELQSRIGQVPQMASQNTSIVDRVKALLIGKPVIDYSTLAEPDPAVDVKAVAPPSPFALFKDATGGYRYVAVATNKYKDKQDERFSEAAHKDYVAYVEKSKDYPELWIWHTPNTRVGQADHVMYDETTGFRISTGTFDKGMEDVAERLSHMPDLAMSHGFIYRKDQLIDGVYHRYRSFEETLLPSADVAANDGTAFMIPQEDTMTDIKTNFLEETLGKDKYARLVGSLGERAKTMSAEELGTAFKHALEDEEPKPPTTPDPPTETETTTTQTTQTSTPTPPADPPEGEQKDMIAAMKAALPAVVTSAIQPVLDGVKELGEWRKEVDAKLVELSATKDDSIAALFSTRGITLNPPSESDDNKIPKAQGEKVRTALGGDVKVDASPEIAPIIEMMSNSLRSPASVS